MKMLRLRLILLLVMLTAACTPIHAHLFHRDAWDVKSIAGFRYSRLFYEASFGIKINKGSLKADFLTFNFGYGKPARTNAWSPLLPDVQLPDDAPQDVLDAIKQMDMKGLDAWQLSLGWLHYFNHFIGVGLQAGWCCITDLSTASAELQTIMSDYSLEKKTFIFNAPALQAAVSVNVFKHISLNLGILYLCQGTPRLTIGTSYAF